MTSTELRKKFLDFFEKKGHKIIPSSSLLPSDSTVLFTTAGMQQFSLYFSEEEDIIKDIGARHLASCQKCFRSDAIEDVGDDTHNTFFEMLGNWSVGQDKKGNYFKEGAIKFALEFLIDELGLDKKRFYITIFKGNKDIPRDEESEKIWQQGIPKERIREFGKEDNLWGPVGETGVCGPNSEIHYDRGEKFGCGRKDCGPNCPYCKRVVEIWNLVFIQYHKDKNGNYQKLPEKSVDTGMGFERVLAILQNKPSAYETDLFFPIIQEIDRRDFDESYSVNPKPYRIIADHLRAICFLIAEGILPSNIEQGYILRRLLRRAIRFGKILGLAQGFLIPLAQKVVKIYKKVYPELGAKQNDILTVIQKEEEKFGKTLEKGLSQFNKLLKLKIKNEPARIGYAEGVAGRQLKIIEGEEAFELYQSYGFPLEMTKELAKEQGFEVNEKDFYQAQKNHQEVSRTGAEKKFGGHGIESVKRKAQSAKPQLKAQNLKIVKLHTATHLLHAALRKILGEQVKQMGSDINGERLRFDFSFDRKMTEQEIKKVEDLVNQKIKEDLDVKKEEMKYNKAIASGALAFFKEKYPEKVNVYSINNFSKEICAGPHIKRTGELGNFKIVKEKSSSAGVRRIKAILENSLGK